MAVLGVGLLAFYARKFIVNPGPNALKDLSISSTPPRNELKPYSDPDAYEVYSAVIPSELMPRTKSLVIVQETKPQNFLGTIAGDCPPENAQLRSKYEALFRESMMVSNKTVLLLPNFRFNTPYVLVPRERIDSFFKKGDIEAGWKEFYGQFPGSGGVTSVSVVAFNAEKTQAYVYMGLECGSLCAWGKTHLLEKKGDRWIEVGTSPCGPVS